MAGKTVLITGASTGIGACAAGYLAERGLHVYAGVRRPEDGERLQSGNITPVILDVTDPESIAAVRGQVGKLDGLVNNAGIVVGGPVELIPLEAWQLQWDVNVKGVIAVTQAFLPLIRESKGRIVNIGSIAGLNTVPFAGAYSMSKFSLEAITDALRIELKPWGIEVAIIEPGSIATPIWQKSLGFAESLAAQVPPENLALYEKALAKIRVVSEQSARRGIHPEYVAKAIHHALTARRPRTRYLIGSDARLRQAIRSLPDRWKDWLIMRKIGL